MATAYSATVQATAARPYILTHRLSGERFAYSEAALRATERLYKRHGRDLGNHYTIVREHSQNV